MKKSYNEIDLKDLFKYFVSCKKIIIIIIFTSIFLTLAFNFITPKFYYTTAIIKASTEFDKKRIINKNNEDAALTLFHEYYLEVLSKKNLKEYLNTVGLNNKNIKILYAPEQLILDRNKLLNIRYVTLESKNFKENLDSVLNEYLIYIQKKVNKKYIAAYLNDYYDYQIKLLDSLVAISNLEKEQSKKLINSSQVLDNSDVLIKEIEMNKKNIDLLKSDNFFLSSFIFEEAFEVNSNMNLLFLLLMSLIVSLFISIFVILIRYCLTK